ncbi:transglycosylase slt domain protein [Lasius niger]|uniref:Transglycosylase slt domain protein n=1 Tax=Lasius niger TaxID=67767 RepID=A0A0J7JV92_LASNI|nr:transglycosylase slt domain protein [Lasius niger]
MELIALVIAQFYGLLRPRYPWGALPVWLVAVALGLVAVLVAHHAHAAAIPPQTATPWERTVIREGRAVWGLPSPSALFGAQIQQESSWRPAAHSPYAGGLAQFTADTAQDMARWYPELGPADPYNPHWAIRALVRYDHRLYTGIARTASDCDRWAMTLSAYNGGAGWVSRDRKFCAAAGDCNVSRWWHDVARYSQRAAAAKAENRAYPEHILHRWHPPYLAAGWGGPEVCA